MTSPTTRIRELLAADSDQVNDVFLVELLTRLAPALCGVADALQADLDAGPIAHYAHHDAKGTSGANCAGCIEQRTRRQTLRDKLDALNRAAEER